MNFNEENKVGTITKHDGTKLSGYLTPDGFFGEIEKGKFQTFESEKEWVRFVMEGK